jgi:hypothetical protein
VKAPCGCDCGPQHLGAGVIVGPNIWGTRDWIDVCSGTKSCTHPGRCPAVWSDLSERRSLGLAATPVRKISPHPPARDLNAPARRAESARGNVGETRNIAQVGFLSKRDPKTALVESAESAEIAKAAVHGVFPPLVAAQYPPYRLNALSPHPYPSFAPILLRLALHRGASRFLHLSQSGDLPDR